MRLRPNRWFSSRLAWVLGLYGLFVFAYLWATYWSSDEYEAAVHLEAAMELLGPSDGRDIPVKDLEAAYQHLLEAARRVPHVTSLHRKLEQLNVRFESRGLTLSPNERRKAEALASVWQRLQAERQPWWGVSGLRDRGWAPEQLASGPGRALRWSALGAVVLVLAWVVFGVDRRLSRAKAHDEKLRQLEREVEARGRQRRPPKG